MSRTNQNYLKNVKNIVRNVWVLAFVSLRRHNQHFHEMLNPGSFLIVLLKKCNLQLWKDHVTGKVFLS